MTRSCRLVAPPLRAFLVPTLLVALIGWAPHLLTADDRNLVQAANRAPYVMLLLDVSGSMNQSVTCTDADAAAGKCSLQGGSSDASLACPQGNCTPRLNGDDPMSKIYQAKAAIYALMQGSTGANFGWATFDQAGLHNSTKFWYYAVDASQPNGFITLSDGTVYPAVGLQEAFGAEAWQCTDISGGSNNALANIGCGANVGPGPTPNGTTAPNPPVPAHLDDLWENVRAHRYPKLGDANNTTWFYYITEFSNNSQPLYKVTFTPIATVAGVTQTLGMAQLQVSVKVDKCNSTYNSGSQTWSNCSAVTNIATKTMVFDKVNEFTYWENPTNVSKNWYDSPSGGGAWWGADTWQLCSYEGLPGCGNASYQNQSYIETNFDTNDCYHDGATAANSNCNAGEGNGVGIKQAQPATADPHGRTPLNLWSQGDMLPLDWLDPHRTQIMQRVAPNILGGVTTPDFTISDYFQDHAVSGESALRLKDNTKRPLAADGGTPTGGSMQGIIDYLATTTSSNAFYPGFCQQASNPATGDVNFGCKSTFLIVVTDGLSSDGNLTCTQATALRTLTYKNSAGATTTYPVRTFMVGMGIAPNAIPTGYTNTLLCGAENGGTSNDEHFFNDFTNPVGFCTIGTLGCGLPGMATPPPAGEIGQPGQMCDQGTGLGSVSGAACAVSCSATSPCDGPGPLYVTNGAELTAALTQVLHVISGQATSFAAAAVPAVQADVNDKIVISTFLPVNGPVWPGSVQAFLAPVPTVAKTLSLPNGSLVTVQVPDSSRVCPGPNPPAGSESCLVWDAAQQLLTLTPTNSQLTVDDYNLDLGDNNGAKRRVFYSFGNPKFAFTNPTLPNERDFLQDPADLNHWTDLLNAMGVCAVGDTVCGGTAANQTKAKQMLRFFYETKSYADPNNPTNIIPFILGDIFHSNPQVLGNPSNFSYFSLNLNNYSAFARTHRYRRKILFLGANDGALHAFDMGLPHATGTPPNRQWTFDDGTGNELFAFVPRHTMTPLNNLAVAASSGGGNETFLVDGTAATGDVFIQPNWSGGTTINAAEWRTVLIGGLREGGTSNSTTVGSPSTANPGTEYFALDVTQPDTFMTSHENPDDATTLVATIPTPNSNYVPSCLNGGAGCGSTPFMTPLWEFDDTCPLVSTCTGPSCVMVPCDEDVNGFPDLGQTWSTPRIGRILVCDGGTNCNPNSHPNNLVDKYVAIFGGGMDPNGATDPNGRLLQGNYLYMVDIQTGKVLYKRQLVGSVPSDVAAVDLNQDGYIDTLYVGTTAGFLYKVDISVPAQLKDIAGVGHRVDPTAWIPVKVFDTGGRPIYYPPAVVFLANSSSYALAFGTGNRWDLWASTALTGRFYFIVDTGWNSSTSGLPLTAANYQQITPDEALQSAGTDFVDNPPGGLKNGWYLELGVGERIVNSTFVLSGVVIFSSYQPQTQVVTNSGKTVCADTGNTRLFVVNALQGDAFIPAGQPGGGRYQTITGALGGKVVALPPPPPSDANNQTGTGTPPPPPTTTAGTCTTSQMQAVGLQLRKLFPPNCRFSQYSININVGLSNTQMQCAAPVPVCIIEQDWKEF